MANIVLLHGMWSHPGVADSLRTHLRLLGHHVVAPALPGHDKRSPLPPAELGRLSLTDYVDSTEQFILDQEFEEPPLLIGHSMGGLIAQLLAVRTPVSGLILINSAAPAGINHITWSSFLSSNNILTQFGFWNKPHKPTFRKARYALFNELDRGLARQIYNTLQPESGRCFSEIVFWWLDRNHTTRIDQAIEAPMLILCGERDRIVHPSVAKGLLKRYPSADFHSFPENGHWFFHEKGCQAIFQEISDWIETLPSDRSSISEQHESPRSTSSPTVSSKQLPCHNRPLEHSGGVRGGTHEDAEAGRGPILPR